jgi:hypothetical protein
MENAWYHLVHNLLSSTDLNFMIAVKILAVVLWVVMLHGLTGSYRSSSKMLVTTTRPQGLTAQKTTVDFVFLFPL